MGFTVAFTVMMNFISSTTSLLKGKIIQLMQARADDLRPHGNGTLFDEHGQILVVVGVCLTGASAAIQALQSTKPLHASSQLVYVGLVISFTSMLVSLYIRPNHLRASAVMMHLGVFFDTTALMLAFVINLSIPFMIASVAVYFVGLLIIVVFKVMLNPTS